MRVNIMPCRSPLSPSEWPRLMARGIEAHGDTVKISQTPDDSDLHIFWGMKRKHGRAAMAAGRRCLIVERAYLGDRFRWHALGFDGLNGMADFCNADAPPDRWERYWSATLAPWRHGSDYALVVGQVPGDASLYGLNIDQWAAEAVREAMDYYPRVVYRPHPARRGGSPRIPGAETQSGTLDSALDGAEVVITYSSNTAVDAVLRGVPAVSMHPGSMAHSVTSHSIRAPLVRTDRTQWAHRLAYAQWTPEELADGTAWAHLRPHV